ncbi:DNA-directed RNA polymerase subunit beta [Shimazuella kribbensis]|uniref:DNA-directed RNA polymerase subunit beta n=1 Tax=Shimazuella kribbensis TaxID=139808 RepID=UPI0004254758|nr:DNA-directed RNA polymerase subunit beta [Shimazuella kribbensis]
MSQSEDKKDLKNEKGKDEQDRLPVGELKWSKEEDQESNSNEKNEQGHVEEKPSKKDNVHEEISATLLDLEKEEQTTISSHEEEKVKKDPLAGIEDTLTPIDFKTYEFDAEQLRAIEQEMNTLNQQKTENELETFDRKQEFHLPSENVKNRHDEEEVEEEYSSDSKWVKRSIWILGVPALLVIVLFVSLIIGHTVVGGQPVSDIFDMGMWMHVYNLIYG